MPLGAGCHLVSACPAVNWWFVDGWTYGGVSGSRTSVTAEAQVFHAGVFPLGCSSGWRSSIHHKHVIWSSSHQTWLTNLIQDNCNGIWQFWGLGDFYQGQFYGRGTTQFASWFIIGN